MHLFYYVLSTSALSKQWKSVLLSALAQCCLSYAYSDDDTERRLRLSCRQLTNTSDLDRLTLTVHLPLLHHKIPQNKFNNFQEKAITIQFLYSLFFQSFGKDISRFKGYVIFCDETQKLSIRRKSGRLIFSHWSF